MMWLQLTSSGNRRQISTLGVPWYSLANALQQQLRETLVAALTTGGKPSLATSTTTEATPPAHYDPPPIRALSENDINSMRSKLVSLPHDMMWKYEGLMEILIIQFFFAPSVCLCHVKIFQPNGFLVRLKDFQTFCEW